MTTRPAGGPGPAASALLQGSHNGQALDLRPLPADPVGPLVLVKVNALREHLDAVADMLRAREARLHDIELLGPRATLRARIPLATLPGLEEALRAVALRSAQLSAWRLHDGGLSRAMIRTAQGR